MVLEQSDFIDFLKLKHKIYTLIEKYLRFDNMEVYLDPLPGSIVTWEEAINYCERLDNGFRLPTIEELNALYDHACKKNNPYGFVNFSSYWSSTEYDEDCVWTKFFPSGYEVLQKKNLYGRVCIVKKENRHSYENLSSNR